MNALPILERESARVARAGVVASFALPLMVALAALAGGALLLAGGRWLSLPAALPFVVWFIALALGTWVYLSARRFRERAALPEIASAVEREQHLRRGALTGLIEVARDGGVFARLAAEALGDRLASVATAPAPAHRRRSTLAMGLALFALAQVLLLVRVSATRRPDGWQALMHPAAAWRGALLAPLAIDEFPAQVRRGGPVVVGISAEGRSRVSVRWRATGSAWRDTIVPVGETGRATALIVSADADLRVVAGDGRSLSDTVRIRVVDRPFLGDVDVRAIFPAYLGRSGERMSADEVLRVPVGTRLAIRARASEPMRRAVLRGAAGALTLNVDGASAAGVLSPSTSGEWGWEVQGEAQPIEDLPLPLRVELVPDSLPRVEIVSPVGELFLGANEGVTLELLAEDDNELRGTWLRRWIVRADGRSETPTDSSLGGVASAAWTGTADVTLDGAGLRPGDALHVELVARDAAPGDRLARSRSLRLRLPTAEEARESARSSADAAVAAAEATATAQRELATRTETEARTRSDRQSPASTPEQRRGRDSASSGTLGYESAERAREIAADQRALESRVRQLEAAAREMQERLARAGALDPALAQQLEDAQRLLREAMTPELAAALQRLESASQQLDGDRTRQSLAELAAQQQRMREALDKSAELLRRAALEGAMQTLADRGAELAEAQRAVADSARTQPETPDRAARTATLERETRDLARSAAALSDRLESAGARTGAAGAEEASTEAQRSAASLADAARDQAAMERAAASMERSADALARAREQQVAEWRSALTDALDRTVHEMLQLARSQDALADRVRRDTAAAATRGDQSALQQGVRAAQQRLDEQARQSALVTPRSQELAERARQRVAQATRESVEGGRGQSEQAMREAANALRQAAAQVTRDRERAASARSASGLPELIEQMQQLAQQQGTLNAQMQGLMPGAQSGGAPQGLDAAGQQRARELARAQREVARQLDDVADSDPSGRATELAREARALAQALDQGAVDPSTQARQERLLRRMLDAGRSLEQEERDEGARRESRAARSSDRFTPGAADPARAPRFAVPTWEELRGLSAADRRLVIEYFRRLNAEARP